MTRDWAALRVIVNPSVILLKNWPSSAVADM